MQRATEPADQVRGAVEPGVIADDPVALPRREPAPTAETTGHAAGSPVVTAGSHEEVRCAGRADGGSTNRRQVDSVRPLGLPELSREPTVSDGEWTLGRLSRLQWRMQSTHDHDNHDDRDDDDDDDDDDHHGGGDESATSSHRSTREVESERLARRTVGFVSTPRSVGETPVRRPPQRRVPPSTRLDEARIAARVRELAERSRPNATQVVEPLGRPADTEPDVLPTRHRARPVDVESDVLPTRRRSSV